MLLFLLRQEWKKYPKLAIKKRTRWETVAFERYLIVWQSHTVFGPRYLHVFSNYMQIDNVHENEHVLRMSQHLCELLPDQRGRNTWAVFQSRNVIPFSPGWLLFLSWILIASNVLGSWSTKRNILARKDLSLATLSGWTFFDEFITAEIVAVSRRYYATSAGFVLCVA